MFLSIILPAHNEENRLPQTLEQVVDFLESHQFDSEILIVENGSRDKTLEIAQAFAQKYPMIRVIHEDLPGKGRAVLRGMREAYGKYRLFADVDFSMPVQEVVRFIPPLVDVPVAIASREAPGAVRYNEPPFRHFTGRVFNTLIRGLVLPGLHDTQCGFKMFRADVVEAIFERQTMLGWSFDVELLYIASRRGYPILEVPIPWYFNADSKVNVFRDSWRMFKDLLTIRQNAARGLYD
jgi:glycosyltransferase involved in cell wall biosynthesis